MRRETAMSDERKEAEERERTVKRGRGRPRLPAEQQRQRLLDAAERSFERNQYEGASVQDIVAEAGMSSRSFYQFFSSKEDLVIALCRERAEAFLGDLESILSDVVDLVGALDAMLSAYLENLPVVLLDLEGMGGSAGSAVKQVRAEYREKIGLLLIREFSGLSQHGVIANPPSPLAVGLVLAGVEGISIRYHSEGRREELLALHPRLFAAIREMFPQVFPG